MIKKILKSIKKFGFSYTFFFTLQKLSIIKEIPVKLLIRKQNYYKNLPVEKQIKELCDFYKNETGKELNLTAPVSFSEKLQWLKFNDSTQVKADLSDKYLAPKMIKEQFGDRIQVIPQLGMWEKAEDIDFSRLPQRFVLKCNHGSAMNIIVKDKSKLNIKAACKKLNDWLKLDYAYVMGMYENHYTYIKPCIIAEEFIEEADGNLHDFKFHCFNGEPKYIQFIGDRVPNSHQYYYAFYDTDWKKTDIQTTERVLYPQEYSKPECYEQMLQLAKELAAPFKYVRVDFYIINNKVYFGEMTFTPDSGFLLFKKEEINVEWGNMIRL